MPDPNLNLDALLRIPYVDPYSGFDLSPDGRKAAFAWNLSGRWEIYEVLLDGSAPPVQITHGPGGKFAPRYTPEGQRLAYMLDLDGSEAYDLYCYDFARNAHNNLTPDTPQAIQPNYAWSPDGAQLALISNHGGYFQTFVMPAMGGAVRLVFDRPDPDWEVSWSPDGRWLAVVAETHGQDFGTFIVPLQGDAARPICSAGQPLNARDAQWSPDSRRIAFSSDFTGSYAIGLYAIADGELTWINHTAGDDESPHWSPDGRRLAYTCSRGENTWLETFDLVENQIRRYQIGRGVHYRPRFTPGGDSLLCVFESPQRPNDLWRLRLQDGSFQQLTRSLPAGFDTQNFIVPQAITYPSFDSQPVPALLYRPAGLPGPGPAAVVIHGGPNWLFQNTWQPLVQHMLSRGWTVLEPNYRGSTGYGRAWQLANRFDLGGGDTRDVVAGADYLVRQGLADPARLAVTGRSHGGYLTMTCLTQYPDRWAAGSAVVPFLNWFTAHANSREDLQHWDIENFGHPQANQALWRERSPYFYLERIQAPVQLICGAHDPRCPASESLAARDRLQALGKAVDLLLYPDEGHAFLNIENVLDAEKRRADFLANALEAS